MNAQQLRAWPRQGGHFDWRAHLAAHASTWWAAAAAVLGLALLLSLQAVMQRSVEQGQLRLAIQATQTSEAKRCTTLAGGRVQEACLLALNEAARVAAERTPQAIPTRSSP